MSQTLQFLFINSGDQQMAVCSESEFNVHAGSIRQIDRARFFSTGEIDELDLIVINARQLIAVRTQRHAADLHRSIPPGFMFAICIVVASRQLLVSQTRIGVADGHQFLSVRTEGDDS